MVMSYKPGDELSTLDFASMVGGPLTAIVKAQAQSAMSTVDFINSVGFNPNTHDPIYVTFQYDKQQEALTEGSGTSTKSTAVAPVKYQLTVPLLTIVPIPYLRVEEVTIDFNAKIQTMEYSRTSSSFGLDVGAEAQASWGWGSAKLNVSASYKKSSASGDSIDRTYSLAVHVKAVQDELPGGMERVLAMLENSIQSVPAKAA